MKTTTKQPQGSPVKQTKANNQASASNILQTYKGKTVQHQSEEELLQGKFESVQLKTTSKGQKILNDATKLRSHLASLLGIIDKSHSVHGQNYDPQGDSPGRILADLLKPVHKSLYDDMLNEGNEEITQLKVKDTESVQRKFETEDKEDAFQHQPNNTGLPDNLKSGIENLSGYSMDDVKVYYNSSQPATLQAHAYAQGTDIHIAPGQEKHLPHEAWHVVQQKQGRVKPTMQMKGTIPVNDDAGLEKEADVMGNKSLLSTHQLNKRDSGTVQSNTVVVQRFSDKENNTRRDLASKSTGVEMQLDHGISQDTIKEFYKVLSIIGSISKELRPNEYNTFINNSKSLFDSQNISSEGVNAFLNLRNNITPGFKNTVGNPGSKFDPQIEIHGAEVIISEQTKFLEIMDCHMRSISRKANIIKQINTLNQDSTEKYRKELNDNFRHLNDALNYLEKSGTVPKYTKSQWYDYGDKKVKKVPGTYLDEDDDLLAALGTGKLGQCSPMTIVKLVNFNRYDIITKSRKSSLTTATVPITVKITVPESTWKHIYERHTIEYFAWDIQAVNTFWKKDPQIVFKDFEDSIADELLLIIDRQMDIEFEINQAKAREENNIEQEGNINEVGSTFFFQGTYFFEEMSDDDEFEKDELNIILKSFAPQSSEIAFVVLPSILNAKKI